MKTLGPAQRPVPGATPVAAPHRALLSTGNPLDFCISRPAAGAPDAYRRNGRRGASRNPEDACLSLLVSYRPLARFVVVSSFCSHACACDVTRHLITVQVFCGGSARKSAVQEDISCSRSLQCAAPRK